MQKELLNEMNSRLKPEKVEPPTPWWKKGEIITHGNRAYEVKYSCERTGELRLVPVALPKNEEEK